MIKYLSDQNIGGGQRPTMKMDYSYISGTGRRFLFIIRPIPISVLTYNCNLQLTTMVQFASEVSL